MMMMMIIIIIIIIISQFSLPVISYFCKYSTMPNNVAQAITSDPLRAQKFPPKCAISISQISVFVNLKRKIPLPPPFVPIACLLFFVRLSLICNHIVISII